MYRLLFLVLALVIWLQTPAQVVLKNDSSGFRKDTVRVRVLQHPGQKPIEYKGVPIITDSVARSVKASAINLIRGEFCVLYEHRLSRRWSITGGLGVTWVDYYYELAFNNARYLGFGAEASRSVFKGGWAVRAEVKRFYGAGANGIGGAYLGAQSALRTWNMDYLKFNGLSDIPIPVSRSWTDIGMIWGYNSVEANDNWFWDAHVAMGIRLRNEDRVRGSGIDAEVENNNFVLPYFGINLLFGFTL